MSALSTCSASAFLAIRRSDLHESSMQWAASHGLSGAFLVFGVALGRDCSGRGQGFLVGVDQLLDQLGSTAVIRCS